MRIDAHRWRLWLYVQRYAATRVRRKDVLANDVNTDAVELFMEWSADSELLRIGSERVRCLDPR